MPAGGLDSATQRQPAQEHRGDADEERQEKEATAEIEPCQVAAHAGETRSDQTGVEDALVLVHAGAEDVGLVAATDRDSRQPSEDDQWARNRHALLHVK